MSWIMRVTGNEVKVVELSSVIILLLLLLLFLFCFGAMEYALLFHHQRPQSCLAQQDMG